MSDLPPSYPGRSAYPATPPRYEPGRAATSGSEPAGLADVLDRILDKGLVIAGDISISLAQVELVTIKIRLLLASADKAREMGIDWWTRDPALSAGPTAAGGGGGGGGEGEGGDLEEENRALRQRLAELESRMSGLMSERESVASKSAPISAPDLIAMREQRTAPPAPRPARSREDGGEDEDDRGGEQDDGDDRGGADRQDGDVRGNREDEGSRGGGQDEDVRGDADQQDGEASAGDREGRRPRRRRVDGDQEG